MTLKEMMLKSIRFPCKIGDRYTAKEWGCNGTVVKMNDYQVYFELDRGDYATCKWNVFELKCKKIADK